MNATHFIEIIKDTGGAVRQISPAKIEMLHWSLMQSVKHDCETIAVFKISVKPKPMIAHYDFNNQVTIVE